MIRIQLLVGAMMRFFSSPPHLHQLWSRNSLLSNGY